MIESIVIWGVIWFFVMGAAVPFSLWAFAGIGLVIGDDMGAFMGAIVGWVLGVILALFSVIQVILHLIHLVQEVNV